LPVEPLIRTADCRPGGGPGRVPGFPFIHAFARLERLLAMPIKEMAEKAMDLYVSMLQVTELAAPAGLTGRATLPPYNLIITRDWMLLAPRSREFFGDISLNALAYAGSFLVKDDEQMSELRAKGPMTALKEAGVPEVNI
ncbi:phosphorylase, partial [Fibrobacterota bacterium]